MKDIKITVVWLILMGLSLIMFVLAKNGLAGQSFVMIMLLSTWFKGQMIIDHFMGLRRVAMRWRLFISVWLVLILIIIFSVYMWAV
jgi:cytochrome c oxidase subunit IV